jgi:hypothetical protein
MFLDAGILIAAVRGQEDEAARALAILEDSERSFIASDFLRLEVLPKALYDQRPAKVALYERFFSKARLIPVSAALVTQLTRLPRTTSPFIARRDGRP